MQDYIDKIDSLSSPSFQQIRRIAFESLSHLNRNERDILWRNLNQGVDLLTTHESMCQYILSYGNMHEAKIQTALNSIRNSNIDFNNNITIIDWGCGQGLATVCYFDFLKKLGRANYTNQVILVEPSAQALERAKLHINHYLKDESKIRLVNKFLDDVNQSDIQTNDSITLHFFSNILDVPQINLKKLAKLVGENVSSEHYFFCVSPLIEGRSHRLDVFYNYFNIANAPQVISNSEKSENQLQLLAEDSHFKDVARNYTLKLKVFKFERNTSYYTPIEYYPSVQFHAGYKLDCIDNTFEEKLKEITDLTNFEVSAPFDLGASVYEDLHPIFAVLNNIITRGLPTKVSPFIESKFQQFGNELEENENGSIKYTNKDWDQDNLQLTYSPISIARLQKTIIEALLVEKLDVNKKEWNVLVKENDVPCAALALADLALIFNNLTSLSVNYDNIKFPKINLEIIGTAKYINSHLHFGIKPVTDAKTNQKNKIYDLVIDISMTQFKENQKFSEFKCKNDCYFFIRSAKAKKGRRHIYTTDTIEYKSLVKKDAKGNHIDIDENKNKLQYFVRLLFRKNDFRSGQLPILNRALQNKSVIGLIPTGGGKSLTYQLAAMLQPGITLIIDPLRSLMKDQYDGLINLGIDTCTFINSSLSSKEKNERERQMETSQMQFVFLSPERLCIFKFRERLKNMRDMNVYFSYGVIDEVHCVSEWGHDFRFSYLHLGRNLYNYVLPKNKDKRLALFGLTATASFDVLADVERELSGNGAFTLDSDTVVRYENTNRLELQYRIEKIDPLQPPRNNWDVYKSKNIEVANYISKIPSLVNELQNSEAIEKIKKRFIEREGLTEATDKIQIQEILKAKLNTNFKDTWLDPNLQYEQGGIVFCPHRKGSLGVKDSAANKGVASSIINYLPCKDTGTFLGGDEMSDQDKFINNDLGIMVATKAFGMGIDKSNVRFTVNVNHSSSLESFVQEAGRAGRDKKMALATILYSDFLDVDKDVVMYFHNNTFKGAKHEKQVMIDLLSKKSINYFKTDDDTIEELETNNVFGFLDLLLTSKPSQSIVSFISYVNESNYNKYENNGVSYKDYNGVDKYDYVAKAIYRMSCIGVVDDFTQDYWNNRFRIVTKRKADGEYYNTLKQFLMRYYSRERAKEEIQRVHKMKGNNEIHRCLGYLTEFIYSKIEVKRKRAINDIRSFCIQGLNDTKDWKEINEDLKDFIYYYFNSKYAKKDYETEYGEAFSLTNDTDFGKKSSMEILLKYLRVVEDDVYGSSGSPIDSIKHLQGAVRLIRRSLTDKNPALAMLNAFCIAYLGTFNNIVLEEELKNSFKEGYYDFYLQNHDKELFYNNIKKFKEKLKKNLVSKNTRKQMNDWAIECELQIHNNWLENFTNEYIQTR